MSRRFCTVIFLFFFALDSDMRNTQAKAASSGGHSGNETIWFTNGWMSRTKSFKLKPNVDSNEKQTVTETHPAEETNSLKINFHHSPSSNNGTMNKIVPEESEKVIFSRKFSPQIGSQDSFIPVPGPYGMKSRHTKAKVLKPTVADSYRVRSPPRNINSAFEHSRDIKNHAPQNVQSVKSTLNVQRRAQFRKPKAIEDLAVRESIANENILGNGNFEIIKGGIYSDQDANEIIGSRRISRGFGSFSVPTYQQRFIPVQNIQFPPIYQRHVQNSFNPAFYPRAPY